MTRYTASNIVHTRFATPLGDMFAAASDKGLVGLWFHDQRYLPEQVACGTTENTWPLDEKHPVLLQTAQQVREYFDGQRTAFDLPFDLSAGTSFQQSVWQALLAIPNGESTSYGELARRIGKPLAVRAVGAAVGRNPISVLVPCHRVLGKNGSLTGYAGGLARKTALLQLERISH